MFDFASKFATGLTYQEFLQKHGTPEHQQRWQGVFDLVRLTPAQRDLLAGFEREIQVLVLAGTWCGDCVNQCPIFEHFAQAAPVLKIRYFDRDENSDLGAELSICGAARVPSLIFLNEDGQPCGRYGDRTLAKYRQMARDQIGSACASGVAGAEGELLHQVTQEWLDEFERIHWMVRTSARLRQKHGD